MPAPLSIDLRKRIIEDRQKGHSIARIAMEKGVSASTIDKLLKKAKDTGSYAPRPLNNGRKPFLSDAVKREIEAKIIAQPDITLDEIIEEFKLEICRSALSKIVRFKLGFNYKKNPSRQWQAKAESN